MEAQVPPTVFDKLAKIVQTMDSLQGEWNDFRESYTPGDTFGSHTDPPQCLFPFNDVEQSLLKLETDAKSCVQQLNSLLEPVTPKPQPQHIHIPPASQPTTRRKASTPIPTQPPTPTFSTPGARDKHPTPPEALVPGQFIAIRAPSMGEVLLGKYQHTDWSDPERPVIYADDVEADQPVICGDAAVSLDDDLRTKMRNSRMSRKVMALYPGCTAFYAGTVSKGVKKHDTQILVNFGINDEHYVDLRWVYQLPRLPPPPKPGF
ncbi:hypothetical protein P9112_000975 [Eukaryota sp. TZLM1-RC]